MSKKTKVEGPFTSLSDLLDHIQTTINTGGADADSPKPKAKRPKVVPLTDAERADGWFSGHDDDIWSRVRPDDVVQLQCPVCGCDSYAIFGSINLPAMIENGHDPRFKIGTPTYPASDGWVQHTGGWPKIGRSVVIEVALADFNTSVKKAGDFNWLLNISDQVTYWRPAPADAEIDD